jgi:hypothetical protein
MLALSLEARRKRNNPWRRNLTLLVEPGLRDRDREVQQIGGLDYGMA